MPGPECFYEILSWIIYAFLYFTRIVKESILTDLPIKIDKIAGIINGESNIEKLIIVVPNPRFPLAR
jgi:hypothetical protein